MGTAALSTAGQLAWADEAEMPALLQPPASVWAGAYPRVPGRVYRGDHLQAVGMPIGGIGTGTIWLDGKGRLGIWQIFNNLTETRIPNSFFGIRAAKAGGEAVVRVLQTEGESGIAPVESLEFEAGYPIARLAFHDAALPLDVRLEAMNPMIPLDTANSSIPGALFRVTVCNTGTAPVDVTLFGTLQNAVGSGGAAGIEGVAFGGYGNNRNRVVRRAGLTAVGMDQTPAVVPTGPVKVRKRSGGEVPGPELLWISGLPDFNRERADALARIAEEGGVMLADGVGAAFFDVLGRLKADNPDAQLMTPFEDFEAKTYEGWTIRGTAFGERPSHGTEAGQQQVTGFAGHGLVNTFQGGDGPQGAATSRTFTIDRRFIGFLIGGGNDKEKTCINLKIDGKVVRTATGENREVLEPVSWDVADLKGKQAVIEIIDELSGPWGHINIDRILLSDVPPEMFLSQDTALESAAKALGVVFTGAAEVGVEGRQGVALADDAPAALKAAVTDWTIARYTRLIGFRAEGGYRALASTATGDPLVIEGPLGKGRIILVLAPALAWSWGRELLLAARGEPLQPGQRIVPSGPTLGTMALSALGAEAVAIPGWTTAEELQAFLADPRRAQDAAPEAISPAGATVNAALAVPFTLQPGASRSATFAVTWHFPNVLRFEHPGNLYARRWPDAVAVAGYLAERLEPLWTRTELYQTTLSQSNLPEEFLDAMATQSVILRGPTCFWSEDGYFGGFEGSYGCCPLNCTHVWNYAQSHARLFPDVGRNMRISNFITFLHPTGETSHREHNRHNAFIDGHCACIEGALREHQLSPDRKFLETIWPGVKKAVDWLIGAIDPDKEGMPHGHQPNTYDTSVSGANTFIGSQYLSALAAAEQLALVMDDAESAGRWRAVREAGMKNQNEKLYNGEYYFQIPEPKPAEDYNTGCHADQLLGQWWAHMLNLGYLYPADRVRSALSAVMKYNFVEKIAGIPQRPRRYVPDDEGGLLMCTWPQGGRPDPFILYADEVWTGIEYSTAGAMVYEGMLDEARKVVRMARSRYDGRLREGLNSGPGGNPYNELECGKFYARAMSSWSLLIASQGLVLDGPSGLLGFKPHWQPEDHRSFYSAPEGWGLFVQQRVAAQQTERIEVRHGRLRLRELVFSVPEPVAAGAAVTVAGQPVPFTLRQEGDEVRLALAQEVEVAEGASLEVTFRRA